MPKASRNFVNLDKVNEADLFRQQKIDALETELKVVSNWMKSSHYRAFLLTMPESLRGKIREVIRLEVNNLRGQHHAWTRKSSGVYKVLSK